MLIVVTVVGFCIFVFSLGYMAEDPRYSRFFAYLSLFAGSMLTLVLANNLLLLYISWEMVGLCSYLLIGFWFEKKSAADAAKKAFIVTRIGDVGLFIGLLILYSQTGHVDFSSVFHAVEGIAHSNPTLVTLVGLLIFAGAVGKSAQFPLHVWLPDAMEGPTPVSALIHAATMVAAGVYLVGRTYPIFHAIEGSASLTTVAWIGAITAIMAASIGVAMNRAKRILAYSTISQLGYMMIGLGVGGVMVGIFHLMTHAFFKALLFLGAGSMMHGSGEHADLNIWQSGGLRKHMPITFWTFLVGTLALAGIFPFAGFWSKDEILLKAFEHNPAIYLLGLAGAFLTAFYMFRLVFVSFFGEARDHKVHAHESPPVMTVPLIILAFFSLVIGWVGITFIGNPFGRFLGGALGAVEVAEEGGVGLGMELGLMGVSLLVALAGIGAAYLLYGRRQVASEAEEPLRALGPVWTALEHKLYFDELYNFLIVQPVLRLAEILRRFDLGIIDGIVNGVGLLTRDVIAAASRWIDTYIVDGAVNLVGLVIKKVGDGIRYIQTGQVQSYALAIFLGVLLLAAVYLLR
jgi:NADH-quinone oxidoreductase subunit L